MSVQETPLAAVKRLYGSKDKLVDSIAQTLRVGDEDEGELKQRLLAASNKKLLRLAEVAKSVTDKYGSKEKLADTIAAQVGKAKDADFVAKLKSYSAPKLLDMVRSSDPSKKKASSK